jgi:hypothetical protein
MSSNSKAQRVVIGDVTLGQPPEEDPNAKNPNPERVVWNKENRVTRHEIPGFKDKTQRTSNETLWTLQLTFKTLKQDMKEKVTKLINEVGPYEVYTAFQSPLQMYVESGNATQEQGYDDDTWTWSLSLIECND